MWIIKNHPNQEQPLQETVRESTNGDSDAWVSVFVPVASLQKHITKANQVTGISVKKISVIRNYIFCANVSV